MRGTVHLLSREPIINFGKTLKITMLFKMTLDASFHVCTVPKVLIAQSR